MLEKKAEAIKSSFAITLSSESAEFCFLATSKTRKEILKRFVCIMSMGQVFLQRSLRLKASDSFSQKKDKRRVELGPGSQPYTCTFGKEL